MQKYIVICLEKGAKVILSKQFFEDMFDGTTLKVVEKSTQEVKFTYTVKCHGWNMEEVIYVVEEEKEEGLKIEEEPFQTQTQEIVKEK